MAHSYAPGGADIKHQNKSPISCTTAARVLEATERRQMIMHQRVSKCMSYSELADWAHREIGTDNLPKGYDKRYVWRDVRWCLDNFIEEMMLDAGQFVAEELCRLEAMMSKLAKRANLTSDDPNRVDLSALDRWLKLRDRRVKLLGLDSPQRISVEHSHRVEIDEQKKLEALRNLRGRLQKRLGKDEMLALDELTIKEAVIVDGEVVGASEREMGHGEQEGLRGGAANREEVSD